MLANCSLGNQPVSMNSAVRKPQAIKAPMFGITIPLRNFPNDDTLSLIAIVSSLSFLGSDSIACILLLLFQQFCLILAFAL